MNSVSGKIFKIKRFSLHDGPGIRTTVFLKGCPLHCIWCHSPEGVDTAITIWHDKNNCIGCGECVLSCPENALMIDFGKKNSILIDRTKCINTFNCVNACPSRSLQTTGSSVNSSFIIDEIKKDISFYKSSGGGITLSGGEPLFQPDFAIDILKKCREEGIHTAMETCLFAERTFVKAAMEWTDLFIIDLKIFNNDDHIKYTSQSNDIIIENFRYLAEKGKSILVRVPLIDKISDTLENIEAIREFVRKNNPCIPVELLIFNPLTKNNYDRLGIPYYMDENTSDSN